ncbi:putative serine/threonine-protein kinase WNK7, partial [Mucuna pruriens]
MNYGAVLALPPVSNVFKTREPHDFEDDIVDDIVEKDLTGWYTRYDEILDRGAFKSNFTRQELFLEHFGRFRQFLHVKACYFISFPFSVTGAGFDEVDGIEVDWNQVKINGLLYSVDDLAKLYFEVNLLKSLKHENIIKFYDSWIDDKQNC